MVKKYYIKAEKCNFRMSILFIVAHAYSVIKEENEIINGCTEYLFFLYPANSVSGGRISVQISIQRPDIHGHISIRRPDI